MHQSSASRVERTQGTSLRYLFSRWVQTSVQSDMLQTNVHAALAIIAMCRSLTCLFLRIQGTSLRYYFRGVSLTFVWCRLKCQVVLTAGWDIGLEKCQARANHLLVFSSSEFKVHIYFQGTSECKSYGSLVFERICIFKVQVYILGCSFHTWKPWCEASAGFRAFQPSGRAQRPSSGPDTRFRYQVQTPGLAD